MLIWNATREEYLTIRDIARRAASTLQADFVEVEMDVSAVHCNGCPLDLEGLLNASDLDFAHDILGIRSHIDRSTGELTDCFVPRHHA